MQISKRFGSYFREVKSVLSLSELTPPLLGMGNDWTPFERAVQEMFPPESHTYSLPVSVVIPVYNRREKLEKPSLR